MKKIAFVLLCGFFSQASQATTVEHRIKYEVTITNTHAFHVLTPPVIIAHNRKFKLFQLAEPATDGLADQAENGDPTMLLNELAGDVNVIAAVTNGELLLPGNSATIEIMAPRRAHFSVSSMLAGTNDAFIAVRDMKYRYNARFFMATVYDAGSEMNSEDCAHIPGPPCLPESGNERATEDAEGFVTISNGVHGGNDLDPQDSDWRGPVAKVSIKVIRQRGTRKGRW